ALSALLSGGVSPHADSCPRERRQLSFSVCRRGSSLSTDLPVLAPCEWTVRGLASAPVEQGDERPVVSLDVAQRHKAAKRAEDDQAVDLASLLSAEAKLNTLKRARELPGAVRWLRC